MNDSDKAGAVQLQEAVTLLRSGRQQDAERLLRDLLAMQPQHPEANYQLGLLATQQNQPAAALRHLKAAMDEKPSTEKYALGYIDALIQNKQEVTARQVLAQCRQHRFRPQALTALAKRLDAPPMNEINLLIALFGQKRYADGESLARDLTQRFPEHGYGWKVLGVMLTLQGRDVDALESMQKASALLPGDEEAHRNLAATLVRLGKLAETEESCRRVLKLKPNSVDALTLLGMALQEQGRHAEAETRYRRVIAIVPNNADAHFNLGNALKDQGRMSDAGASYQQALKCDGGFIGAYNNLGNVFVELRKFQDADKQFRCALALAPDNPDAHFNLGNSLDRQGRIAEAEVCYKNALALVPDYYSAQHNLVIVLKKQGKLAEAEASLRRSLARWPDDYAIHSHLLFNLNYGALHSAADCLEEARRFGRKLSEKVKVRFTEWACLSSACDGLSPTRLRVGMVSGDLRNHPVGFFVEGLVRHIDPAVMELIALPTLDQTDELTERIRPYFLAWKPLFGLTDERAAEMIHADGVHVLVDLSGHSVHNRLPVFASKPAPVQVSWPGYFATTGLAEMDYVMADRAGVPETLGEQFTERVWYLPETRLCFTAPAYDIAVSTLPAQKNPGITFGCFQNYSKIGDEVLAVWAEILTALPTARLRMQCEQLGDLQVRERFGERWRHYGIDPERIDMHGLIDRQGYLLAHHEVDVLLDTFPYPGGTTTCEALWMGVPTVTLAGNTMISRQGASLLSAAGLPEFVTSSTAEYVGKAVALAGELPVLAALRAGLRQQVLASPLFDAKRFARHFEAALWGMFNQRAES